MRETFDITGMSCASCAAHVEKAAGATAGVTEANVNLLKNSMEVEYDGSPATVQAICRAVKDAGYGATPRTAPTAGGATKTEEAGVGDAAQRDIEERRQRLVISAIFSIPLFYLAMGPMFGWPQLPALASMEGMMAAALTQLLLCLPIIFVNRGIFASGLRTLWHRAPNMDSLIAIGSGASLVWSIVMLYAMAFALGAGDVMAAHGYFHSLYFDSAGMILTLITLGKFFEARAKGKTTDAIAALMDLAPKTATVVRDGQEVRVPTEEVRVGERVVVRAGESVPVDGVVVEGSAAIDESAITGEPVPAEKGVGDHVTGATVSTRGWFAMEATAVGDDTTLAGIIRLVDEATSSKAPIERQADRIAGWFVPAVLAVAAVTFVGWVAVFLPGDVATALTHAISVLVISCPCALGLATPTAVMVGTGRGAANGILIKDATSLETAGSLGCVVMDKTGTVTEGRPRVTGVTAAPKASEDELLRVAAALERKSEHPLAQAVVDYADERDVAVADVEDFYQVAGGGLTGTLDGVRVAAGNARLMETEGVDVSVLAAQADAVADAAGTPLFFAEDGRALGLLAVADVVKPTSAGARRGDPGGCGRGHRRRPARPEGAEGRRPPGRGPQGGHGGRRHQRRTRPGACGRGHRHRGGHRRGHIVGGRGAHEVGPSGRGHGHRTLACHDAQHPPEPLLGALLQHDLHPRGHGRAGPLGDHAQPHDRRGGDGLLVGLRGHERPAPAYLEAQRQAGRGHRWPEGE